MRYPRLVSWCLAGSLFISIVPVVGAASAKSQTIQVLIIIPERPAQPGGNPASDRLPRVVEESRPMVEHVTTVLRNGNPTRLYTYTEPN